jgi:hypothetical protein
VPDKNETPEQEGPTSSAYTIPSTFYLSSGGKSSLFAQKYRVCFADLLQCVIVPEKHLIWGKTIAIDPGVVYNTIYNVKGERP